MTKMRTRLRLAGGALAVLACLGGCTILDPHVPTPDIDLPNLYTNQKGKLSTSATPYDFAAFKSKYLSELVALGRGFNFNIGAAIARIQEAEASVRIAEQQLIPTITTAGTGASQSLNHVERAGG